MLYLDTDHAVEIIPDDIIAFGAAVLGSRRSGKSNTVARLIELLLPFFPFIVVDPHDEYWGLQEQFPLLIVGHEKSKVADLRITPDQAAGVAEFAYSNKQSVLLELLMFDEDERDALMLGFFGKLWNLAIQADPPTPYGIVLEEAHNFIPEGMTRSPVRVRMKKFALEGGKFGFGIILATQTTTEISKTVLKQMGLRILHRVNDMSDIKRYKEIVPLRAAQVETIVRDLHVGEAIAVRGNEAQRVLVQKRDTFHVGATPMVNAEPPPLRKVDAAMLDKLQASLQRADVAETPDGAPDDRDQVIAQLRQEARKYETLAEEAEGIARNGFEEMRQLRAAELAQRTKLIELLSALGKVFTGEITRLIDTLTGDDVLIDQINNGYGAGFHVVPVTQATANGHESVVELVADADDEPEEAHGPAVPGPALTTGRENILRILQRLNTHDHRKITVNELAVQALYAPKGGGFLRVMKTLRDDGLIVTRPDGTVELTENGIIEAWNLPRWEQTPEALVEAWCNKLQTSAARILPELARMYPDPISKEDLAANLDYSAKGGGFLRGMKLLRSSNLIENDDFGAVAAATGLFLVDKP